MDIEFYRKPVNTTEMSSIVKRKWREDTLCEGFIPFPKTLLRTVQKLLPGDDALDLLVTLMSIIDFRGSSKKTSGPSLEYLSFIGDVDVNDTANRLTKLKELGLIKWKEVELEDRQIMIFDLKGLYDKIAELGTLPYAIKHDDIPF